MNLKQLANNVWIYPTGEGIQPTVGVVTTAQETVLIDSGNSPKHAQAIQHALHAIHAPPVKYIIYTHHHWDHTFGGCAFNGATVIGHRLCFDYLKEYSIIPWSEEFLQNEISLNPALKDSHTAKINQINRWEDFRIQLPHRVFDQQLELHLEGITLQLKYIGGIHASDSITVKVNEANILYVGDCFYPPPLHERTEGDTYSVDILQKMVEERADLYVHGHGEPASFAGLQRFKESLI